MSFFACMPLFISAFAIIVYFLFRTSQINSLISTRRYCSSNERGSDRDFAVINTNIKLE